MKHTQSSSVWVNCKRCGWVNEKDTEFLNIAEDMQGKDVLTFRCKCGKRNESVRVSGSQPGDKNELIMKSKVLPQPMFKHGERFALEKCNGAFAVGQINRREWNRNHWVYVLWVDGRGTTLTYPEEYLASLKKV